MKKAILYARVSTALQEREHTIDSQILELKKQIATAGNVLVKEYIDNGYSGAQLDRPGLDQLRNDLKTDLFDTIYFHNTDRIAREVTYQTIIISEILKYKKQIIINGKDYVHNPENKFSLTVLGAVAELERAKIIERLTRGKQHRLRQGHLLSQGHNTFGYDYIKRTDESPAEIVLNEKEAEIIKEIFTTYAKGNIGINKISRNLEDRKIPRKRNGKGWNNSQLRYMLKNEVYTGIRYFNTKKYVRQYANPLDGIQESKYKVIKRPREEWIGIKVPHIISRTLYDKVQKRFEWNMSHYRNPPKTQLLSNLIKCGECGSFCFAYSRYYKEKRLKSTPEKIYHKVAYRCGRRAQAVQHSKNSDIKKCFSKEIKAEILENHIFSLFTDIVFDPQKLRIHVDVVKDTKKTTQTKMEKELKGFNKKIRTLGEEKKRILDLYASGGLDKGMYGEKSLWYDNEINKIKIDRGELVKRIPVLHKREVIDASIKDYCSVVKRRYNKAIDFDSKRQFMIDYITHIIFENDNVILHGSIPVKLKVYEGTDQQSEAGVIKYCIESLVNKKFTNKETL